MLSRSARTATLACQRNAEIRGADNKVCSLQSTESVVEQNKERYYLALRQTQATIRTIAPDWGPWLLFFLSALHQQMRRLAKKMEREKLMLASLPDLSVQILDQSRTGRVTAQLEAVLGALKVVALEARPTYAMAK